PAGRENAGQRPDSASRGRDACPRRRRGYHVLHAQYGHQRRGWGSPNRVSRRIRRPPLKQSSKPADMKLVRPIVPSGPLRPAAQSSTADFLGVGDYTMSDAEIDGNEVEPEAEAGHGEPGSGGLRKAMEQRVKSLQDAEERIRREQSALQEQAKVVFAEREARLARREKELAKREAALAVSEGIAGAAPAVNPDHDDREHAITGREQALEQLASELEAREAALAAEPAAAKPSAAEKRRIAELEGSVASLEQELADARAAAASGGGEHRTVDARQAE